MPYIIQKNSLFPSQRDSQSALQHDILWSPSQRAFTERGLESLFDSTHKGELHRGTYFWRDVVFYVLPVRPWEDHLGHVGAVCAEDFLFDAANGADTPSQGDLEVISTIVNVGS